jgi:broad specificity phosphatase PhoE
LCVLGSIANELPCVATVTHSATRKMLMMMTTDKLHTPAESSNQSKIIFLIRHAESKNNVDKREAKLALKRLWRLQSWPSWGQWLSIISLLTVPMNTDLSSEGEQMVQSLGQLLRSNDFIQKEHVELIVHSHLTRARRTCEEVFSIAMPPSMETLIPMVQHDHIFEKNIAEHIGLANMKSRIRYFTEWIMKRNETVIVVVGHSAFFRDFLETDCRMDNCEMRRVELTTEGSFRSCTTVVQCGVSLLLN